VLTKIISGGQTGADRGGLVAGKEAGIATGGWMPKGYIAQDGCHPEFAELYGIQEHPSPQYPPRTFLNAKESDGTVRFAINFNSPGEICTLNAVHQYKKLHFDVNILGTVTPGDLAAWIRDNNIKTLNVAGNSEKSAPGIEEFVIVFLLATIEELNGPQRQTSSEDRQENPG